MLNKIQKQIIIIAMIIASILIIKGDNVFAADFNSNLTNIKSKVTPEKEVEFINNDKAYLNSKPSSSDLEKEIKELETELGNVKNDYITTSNNVKIYTGNAALKNSALRTAIVNRKDLIKSGAAFKYDDQSKYTLERDYDKEQKVRKTFTQEQMDNSLASVKEVIENLDMDMSFLKDTTFVLSPYSIDGINGYTLTRPNGTSAVVISNQNMMAPGAFIQKSIKSTTLHEIGHVFYNKKQVALKENNIKIESDATIRAENVSGWKTSQTENFAEDFRIFASSKLGNKSFEPMKKKTEIETNHQEFAKAIEKVAK